MRVSQRALLCVQVRAHAFPIRAEAIIFSGRGWSPFCAFKMATLHALRNLQVLGHLAIAFDSARAVLEPGEAELG